MTWIQQAVNGIILGATIGLGAIGLTLTYAILRFANFTHGEFIAWGAYLALGLLALPPVAAIVAAAPPFAPLTFGWPLVAVAPLAALLTAGLALALDRILFRPLARRATELTLVIASFGASLALRNLLVFLYGPQPDYFTREIPIARALLPGVRVTADQAFLLAVTATLVTALHLTLTRTSLGRAMRATSENPTLAQVAGIDPGLVARWTWIIGAGLAAIAGLLIGLTVQVRPLMGSELLLPLFAAAILGGIGSVPGALLGGLIVGLAEAFAVPLIGAGYRAAVSFLILLAVLLVRPRGLLGSSGDDA
jgi:branched-chain amino acid transport system permease protein